MLGIATPLAAAVVWALFASPQASLASSGTVKAVVQLAVFGLAAVALVQSRKSGLAALFAGVAVANTALMIVWQQMAAQISAPPATLGVRAAGAVYVIAWAIGLLVAPTGPPDAASAAGVHAYQLAHRGPMLVQSLLVHGAAGLALAAVVFGLSRRQRHEGCSGRVRSATLLAGLLAAGLSLLQVAIHVVLVTQLDAGDAARTMGLRATIDLIDSVKLTALGLLVAGATLTRLFGPSLRVLGAALAPALWAGALSFHLGAALLTVALYMSLPLLLLWVFTAALRTSTRPAMQGAS